ncbi:hypothetical protein [Aurantibacter sp.]|uniref:hypothetical protein n=1 Tax=Aurantibacter sp. TaxID=2807103 RepID=UPI0032677621
MKTKILLSVLIVGLFTIFMACSKNTEGCEETPEACLIDCAYNPGACFDLEPDNVEMVTDSALAVSKLPIRK